MSRANANNKNNPANRGIGGHIKEGLKNVPKMYGALYNAKQGNAKLGVGPTVKGNVSKILTGKANSAGTKTSAGTRAAILGAGASSVTPLGPIVAIGLGIKKSVQDKKDAKARLNPPTPKAPTAPKVKPPPTPKQVQKAKDLKKTLNNAFPGLNMK